MKHLSAIQTEFLKEARKWNDLSIEQQRIYLKKHPKSKRKINAKDFMKDFSHDEQVMYLQRHPKLQKHIPDEITVNPAKTKIDVKSDKTKKLDKFDISQLTSVVGKKNKDLANVVEENTNKISGIAKNIAGDIFSIYREQFKDGDEPDEVIDDMYDRDNVSGLVNDLNIDETKENKQWVKDNFDWIVHAIGSKLWEKFDKKNR